MYQNSTKETRALLWKVHSFIAGLKEAKLRFKAFRAGGNVKFVLSLTIMLDLHAKGEVANLLIHRLVPL